MNPDTQVVVLLCSVTGRAADERVRPLAAGEWSNLERRIASSGLTGPGALLGFSTADVARALNLEMRLADRIAALLGRQTPMEIELDRLSQRGIGVLTRIDPGYPSRLGNSLKRAAPPVLFTAGRRGLLDRGGIAAVGSRNIDLVGQAFAKEIGRKCALSSLTLISGGARGSDALAMQSAIESGGTAVGVLADSLERAVARPDLCGALENGDLLLMTHFSPAASFTVAAAMERNKIIYALSDYAVVVSSEVETGGSWRGAVEALKTNLCPVFARTGDNTPPGNRELLEKGALALPESELKEIEDIREWMKERSAIVKDRERTNSTKRGEQPTLFD